jgi:hypothetical protein
MTFYLVCGFLIVAIVSFSAGVYLRGRLNAEIVRENKFLLDQLATLRVELIGLGEHDELSLGRKLPPNIIQRGKQS